MAADCSTSQLLQVHWPFNAIWSPMKTLKTGSTTLGEGNWKPGSNELCACPGLTALSRGLGSRRAHAVRTPRSPHTYLTSKQSSILQMSQNLFPRYKIKGPNNCFMLSIDMKRDFKGKYTKALLKLKLFWIVWNAINPLGKSQWKGSESWAWW